MMRVLSSRQRGASLACAVVLMAMPEPALAAQMVQGASPLQECLDERFEKWVNGRVELVLNEDAKAGDVDDAAVAKWTLANLDACRAQAGAGDQGIEERFTKRMAQWREHIYNRVQRMRELDRPD